MLAHGIGLVGLHKRVDDCGLGGMCLVTTLDIRVADFAALKLHRTACDGHLAKIEWSARGSRSSTNHDSPDLGRAEETELNPHRHLGPEMRKILWVRL